MSKEKEKEGSKRVSTYVREVAKKIGASNSTIKKTEDDLWVISGKFGEAWPNNGYLWCSLFKGSTRGLNSALRKMPWIDVICHCEREVTFKIPLDASGERLGVVRKELGIKKRRHCSPETLERLQSTGFKKLDIWS